MLLKAIIYLVTNSFLKYTCRRTVTYFSMARVNMHIQHEYKNKCYTRIGKLHYSSLKLCANQLQWTKFYTIHLPRLLSETRSLTQFKLWIGSTRKVNCMGFSPMKRESGRPRTLNEVVKRDIMVKNISKDLISNRAKWHHGIHVAGLT